MLFSAFRIVFLGILSALLIGETSWGLVQDTAADQSATDGNTADPATADRSIQFARDIQPILSEHCFACHGTDPESREAGLRLDDPDAWSAELESGEGQAIVPGDPDSSVLIYRIESTDWAQMPPEDFAKPLSDEQRQLLRRWVQSGASWQKHWAYAPLTFDVPDLSAVAGQHDWVANWSQQPIDRFLVRAMLSGGDHQVRPNPKADPVVLMRRVHFDLTGLPPTPERVAQFAANPTAAAYEGIVDQLLASDAHAEHLTRYWMDWVRFADTVGYHGDQAHAVWPYRDYVIKAFADNKPFDQFTIEQLAGDLLENPSEDQLIATAYNRLLQTTHEGGAQDLEYREKYLADRVRNFSEVWLASTMGCAQCHDHKYDPITQDDFYSLGAFFADVEELGSYDGAAPNSTPTLRHPQKQVISPLDRDRVPEDLASMIEQAVAKQRDQALESAVQAKRRREKKADPEIEVVLSPQETERVVSDLRERVRNQILQEHNVRFGQCMFTRSVDPRQVRLLPRGDWMDRSGPVVTPHTPSALPEMQMTVGTEESRPSRLDLAKWLFQEDNPLPARVLANRLWYIAFHRGLSSNLGDFGFQGQWPSHPELLDYLADRLKSGGWNVRDVLREIVLSEAYQQSSAVDDSADPGNQFYTRQTRPRLAAEEIRDNALAVSGLLVGQVGGPSVKPYQPKGYYRSLNFPVRTYQPSSGEALYRRGVYTHWQRQFLHPMLKAFDAPTREECTAERPISNTPSASLVLLNAPEFVEAARHLALRAFRETNAGDEVPDSQMVIQRMFQLTMSRSPDAIELARLAALFDSQIQRAGEEVDSDGLLQVATPLRPEALKEAGITMPQLFAYTQVARVLLNLDESITRY